jgi:4-aminobutyrate aminotransferase/(S)-3-amino-2-methylpropionate transaminase
MLAVEVVIPGEDGAAGPAPDPVLTAAVARAAHELGLLLLTCGTYGNVIRLLPPLIISDEELDRGLTLLEQAFATTA